MTRNKLAFLLLITFIFDFHGISQNLVPNYSFEDVNICTEIHQPCSPSAWFYVNHLVPQYSLSDIPAFTGYKALNLLVVDTARRERQYWQSMLLCPLEKGKKYTVRMKLAATYIGPNLNDIGVSFSGKFIFLPKDTVFEQREYLNFKDAEVRRLKKGWIEVKKEFIASGSEQFIMIGNFSNKTNQEISKERNIIVKRIYLAVDDLSILPDQPCKVSGNVRDSLYALHDRHSRPEFIVKENLPVKTLPAPQKIDTIVIRDINFDFDKAFIKNPDTLNYLKKYLSDPNVKKIKVIGFTDNAGTANYNLRLSQQRADAVVRYFIETFGLEAGKIEAEGKGISIKYVEPYLNRRVEVYLFY
jgi:hypothetical protein